MFLVLCNLSRKVALALAFASAFSLKKKALGEEGEKSHSFLALSDFNKLHLLNTTRGLHDQAWFIAAAWQQHAVLQLRLGGSPGLRTPKESCF